MATALKTDFGPLCLLAESFAFPVYKDHVCFFAGLVGGAGAASKQGSGLYPHHLPGGPSGMLRSAEHSQIVSLSLPGRLRA